MVLGLFNRSFWNDRFEAELGIQRKSAGASYNIPVIQIINSLPLQQLKLFSKLDIEKVFIHTFSWSRRKLIILSLKLQDMLRLKKVERFRTLLMIQVFLENLNFYWYCHWVIYVSISSVFWSVWYFNLLLWKHQENLNQLSTSCNHQCNRKLSIRVT